MENADPRDMAAARPVRIELLVVDLMNRLLAATPAETDARIGEVLELLGQACRLDRTFLFRVRPDGTQYNSHEWVAPGVVALKDWMQQVDPGRHASWQATFRTGAPVIVTNRDALPEDLPERAFLTAAGVRATLMLPLCEGERWLGIIGFDSEAADRGWGEDEIDLLRSVGRAVQSVLLRSEAALAEAASRSHLQATLRALPDLVIEISPRGSIAACHSDKLP